MNRAEQATLNHQKGYNCCQAIVCAFADKMGMDEKDLFQITEGLGAGCADFNGTCGAVTAMAIILSKQNSSGNLDRPDTKADTYKKVRELNAIFREHTGSTICREIKGMDTGNVLRSCPECIEDAASIIAEAIGE